MNIWNISDERDAYYMVCACGERWEDNRKGVEVEGENTVRCGGCGIVCRVSAVFVNILLGGGP